MNGRFFNYRFIKLHHYLRLGCDETCSQYWTVSIRKCMTSLFLLNHSLMFKENFTFISKSVPSQVTITVYFPQNVSFEPLQKLYLLKLWAIGGWAKSCFFDTFFPRSLELSMVSSFSGEVNNFFWKKHNKRAKVFIFEGSCHLAM